MIKKNKNDEFNEEFNEEFKDGYIDSEEVENIEDDSIDIDDDGDIDIVIEVDDYYFDSESESNIDDDSINSDKDLVLSKHKIEGKHSLKYDSIFKGRKDDSIEEESTDQFPTFSKDSIEVDRSSNYHHESINNEEYIRGKKVKERVYEILKKSSSINFMNNRRKPSRVDFNSYFELLKDNLKQDGFTNVEIFNELAVYFSDNLFNMFKLLDNKWRNVIIQELQDHIGKNSNSKDVQNRNIYEGTEIEFRWIDKMGEEMIITGVVLETNYLNSSYSVDSYENIYEVELKNITKILNNTKFKYNLNRLNNIDFL
jgi:hypothetical protein